MIRPTVGRVVWFYPAGSSPGNQPLAAIIAHVHSDTRVNLAIFDPNGVPMADPPTSIPLAQDEDGMPASGFYCMWMPYQKGQAAKAEALESKLSTCETTPPV